MSSFVGNIFDIFKVDPLHFILKGDMTSCAGSFGGGGERNRGGGWVVTVLMVVLGRWE